jgi:CubicO group peptidase (beta-lactamase class C family)
MSGSTRERILDAAATVMREQGLGAASVKAIAAEAGCSPALLYKYFDDQQAVTGRPRLGSGRRDVLTGMPLIADPGTSFHYGTSMDWLGLILERVTGSGIDLLYRERLFEPLGMTDTTVWARGDPHLRERVAAVHVWADGGWQGTDADYWAPEVSRPEFFPAGHCLYATAGDFMRLQQVALGGGALEGVRIVPEHLADQLYVNQIGDRDVGVIGTAQKKASADVDLHGWKWSLGLLLATEERRGMRSPGSAGWAGGFNTFYWMDRQRGITAALHTATLPFYEPRIVRLYEKFEREVNR